MGQGVSPVRIVGRQEELAELDRFLAALREGPAVLVLEGEPGIGKTTLWERALDSAREMLFCVLACRAVEAEVKLGFVGLGDLLEPVLDEALPQLPEPQRRALDVALLRAEAVERAADPRAVAFALLSALRRIALVAPVLVAVDDVPWLDKPSRGAIDFAFRRLVHEPIGFLGTARREIDEQAITLQLAARAERMTLTPLSVADLDHLVRANLDTRLLRPTLVRLHDTSGGNPFFALEIARALRRRDVSVAPGEPLPIPNDLRELLRRRLARLPAATRRALTAAAALAQPTVAIVGTAVGGAPALAEATRSRMIEIEDDRIRFAHPLLPATLYLELSAAQRRDLHHKLADAVADPEERAHHLALAVEGPDPQVAATLEEAANRARARGAWEAAADLAEQALLLTPDGRLDDVWRRAFAAADWKRDIGDYARATELLEQVASGQPPRAIRSRAHHLLGLARWFAGDINRALEFLELASSEADDDAACATVERDIGMLLVANWEVRRAEPHVRVALELSERLDDPALLVRTLPAAAMIEFVAGRGTRFDLLERAHELEAFVRDERTALRPTWLLATILSDVGDLDEARPLLQDLLRRAVDIGDIHYYPEFAWRLAWLELRAGDHERAADYIADAIDVAHQIETEMLGLTLALQASIRAHRGDIDAARKILDEARSAMPVSLVVDDADCGEVAAFIAASVGDPDELLEVVDGLYDRLRESGVGEPTLFRFLPDEIEALIAVDRLSEARRLLDWFEERGRALDRPWTLATGGRCRALVHTAEGDYAAALASIGAALSAHKRLPMPFELARTLLVKGTIEWRARRRHDARESLAQAVERFEGLGAPLWREKARAELARIGGRVPAGSTLSSTEASVAELVAAGRSNYEVARTLFLSPKTVEWNLTKIYRKLHVHSRSELAAKLAKQSVRVP